ncbi:MAG: hypothetical protein U1F71_03565 [Verrucomicrobiaceae bacterium]
MREHHDAEEPAEGGKAHQEGDDDGPPKNAAGILSFGKTAASIGSVLVSVAEKSNLHGKNEKILISIGWNYLNSTSLAEFEKNFL